MTDNFQDGSVSPVAGAGKPPATKKSTESGGIHVPHFNQDTVVGFDLATIAISQTDANLETSTGALGDHLETITCVVTAVGAGGASSLKDGGGSAIPLTPVNAPIGTYIIPIQSISLVGAWNVTTGANVTVFASGIFS